MLEQLDLERILFLDIETVSAEPSWDELAPEWQQLWAEKSKFFRDRDQIDLAESYERAGIYSEFGKIVCIVLGRLIQRYGEPALELVTFDQSTERELLVAFSEGLERWSDGSGTLLCAHNGKEFDFPYIARRMLVNQLPLPELLNLAGKKPWEVRHLDTMELWKFGDYKHYTSLNLLARLFEIPSPKSDLHGSQVGAVYWKDRNLERISDYCRQDVLTVAQLLLRYCRRPLVDPDYVEA